MRIRRRLKTTLGVSTTFGFRRGQVLEMDGELLILRRVVGSTTLDVRPYRGWRRWRHERAVWVRYRWRGAKDRVVGWFERDDEE